MSYAVLIVDMQNDFVSRGGYYDRRQKGEPASTLQVPSAPQPFQPRADALEAVLERICDLLARARKESWLVVFILAAYGHGFTRRPRFLLGSANADRQHYACKPESWGSRLIDPLASLLRRPDRGHDVVLYKNTLDGFHGTGLRKLLSSRGVTTVGLAGVETHACVLSTAMSAGRHQFEPIILEDCTWTAKPDLGRMALALFAEAFGHTTTARCFG